MRLTCRMHQQTVAKNTGNLLVNFPSCHVVKGLQHGHDGPIGSFHIRYLNTFKLVSLTACHSLRFITLCDQRFLFRRLLGWAVVEQPYERMCII